MARSPATGWRKYVATLLAHELSSITKYYDRLIQWMPRDEDDLTLLGATENPLKQVVVQDEEFPDLSGERDQRTAILVNGTFNHHFDIQGLLMQLKPRLSRTSRLLVILYSPYLRWLYKAANRMNIRRGELPSTFLTRVDVENLAEVSGFELIRERQLAYVPWRLLGLGDLINRTLPMVPLLRWFALTYLVVLRPRIASPPEGLSCVIPARNERGNIENALKRLENFPGPIEIIFVEGHSSDGTWEEIQRVTAEYRTASAYRPFSRPAKERLDAVRLGFSKASEPLLTILDDRPPCHPKCWSVSTGPTAKVMPTSSTGPGWCTRWRARRCGSSTTWETCSSRRP